MASGNYLSEKENSDFHDFTEIPDRKKKKSATTDLHLHTWVELAILKTGKQVGQLGQIVSNKS